MISRLDNAESDDPPQLLHAHRRKPEFIALFKQRNDDRHRRHRERALLGHILCRLRINQRRMLNRSHPQRHGPAHRLLRVTVSSNIETGAVSLFDSSANLVVRVLAAVKRVRRRRHPSRCHDLDVRSSAAKLLAHRLADRISTVRNDRQLVRVIRAAAEMPRLKRVVPRTKVAVPTGLRDDPATIKQSRNTVQQTIFDGQHQANVRAADITQRREPAGPGSSA